MKVVDAGVLVVALTDGGPTGQRFRMALANQLLAAPALIDVEVASTCRRLVRHGTLSEKRAVAALAHLVDLPLERAPMARLLRRGWELRDTVTSYDAAYVALAELLGVALITTDARLSRAPGIRCPTSVLR